MRLLAALLVILAVLVGVFGPQVFFVVDETQSAIVTRFGEPRASYNFPGLKVKLPFAEQVTYFDKRRTLFDAEPDRLLTSDKEQLIIDVYAIGRVIEPLTFFLKVKTAQGAVSAALPIVASALREEIARDEQSQIIRTSRDNIMDDVRRSVTPELAEFGIGVVDVRVMRIDFPEQIAPNIYARMQAERKRIAAGLRSEGEKRSLEIKADVDRKAQIIRAQADRDADIIRGCGLAEATKIFAVALEQDPEFYTFERSLEVYKTYLTQNTTMVGSAQDLGQKFEDIRQAVIKAVESPIAVIDGVDPAFDTGEIESRCARLAARQLLSSELAVDQAELGLISIESVVWTDTSLGCPIEGLFYDQEVVPGYRIDYDHQGTTYKAHSNTYGSELVVCK